MSDESVSREELRQKLENTIKNLSQIVAELTLIASNLKLEATKPSVPKPVQPPRDRLGEVKKYFPRDLEEMLLFEESQEYIVLKPRQYLGSENFAKIASIVRGMGGEYVSAGRESHFRVPK